MIKPLIAAIALLAPAAAAAQVIEPSRGRLEILGTSRPACVMGSAASTAGNNMTFRPLTTVSGQVELTEFVDGNAVSRGGSIEVILPLVCNAAHRVTVRSANGGLRRAGPPAPPSPFAELLPYSVNTVWGSQQAGFTTNQGGPLVISAAEARAGQLSIAINVAQGGPPLVAGRYGDQIVLEVEAAN